MPQSASISSPTDHNAASAEALLFGLALGDALGWPVEFKTLDEIKKIWGREGIQEPPDPALYTDDTQMTVALAEGLLENRLSASVDTQMEAVGHHFISWLYHTDTPSRAPGNTCIAGVRRFEASGNWQTSGISGSKGCGSAMRVAPIGFLYQYQPDRLREVALASSQITHAHPAARAAAVAGAYLVKLALDGVHPNAYLRHVVTFTNDISDEFDLVMLRVGHVLGWTDEEAALRHLGEGWTGDEAIALALYCVLRYPDDYTACVRRAANTNGDSDSIACIAGGIMGARLGLDAIPLQWRAHCENREMLVRLATRLADARTKDLS